MSEKHLTIRDIAILAGVSTATVSHFLNGKLDRMSKVTQERLARVIRETGYTPNAQARSLQAKHSGVIAVLIQDNTNIWAGELVRGVEASAHAHGYQTVVCDTHFDPTIERAYVDKMLSLGVDGFVIQPTTHYRSVAEHLRRAHKPVVFYDFNAMDLATTWVKTDLQGGVYEAIDACARRGYDNFFMVSAGPVGMRTRAERHHGVSDALAEHGLTCQLVRITREGPSEQELTRHFEQAINPAKRTLIFCAHQWALGRVFKALRPMRHLMPERIGLLGLNNDDWAELADPPISTIVEPVEHEGRLAFEMLMRLMSDEDTSPQQEMLACTIRWRASTL